MSLEAIPIFGLDSGGLQTNKKPVFIPEQAYQVLENAYTYRDRTRKREGLELLGQLQRTGISVTGLFLVAGSINLISALSLEGTASIAPGTINITGVSDGTTYTDPNLNGVLVATGGSGTGGIINYATGLLTIIGGGTEGITGTFSYFPGLPGMGTFQRELAAINDLQTIFFDQKYAYIWNGTTFQEFIPGTTWGGTNSDFFWCTNYRGIEPQNKLFYVTNFVNDAADPMRYTDGTTWTNFAPVLSGSDSEDIIVGNIASSGTTFTGTLNPLPIASSLMITVVGISFTDPTGSGTLTGNPASNTGTINYATGVFTLNFNPTVKFSGLISGITNAANGQVTSVAHNLTTGAQVAITGVNGMTQVNNQMFTITVNSANTFLLNVNTTGYGTYTNGGTWAITPTSANVLASYETANVILFQARILIPYFGRLIALNTIEGPTIGTAANIYNRCRFSQIGSPIQADAWRSDIFGKGGFLDAPTNEQITSATFLNNTLIVEFENTTWQLRYVGEYGLPFIWERIASDLGSDSTFSSVLFNDHILAIGDKAIIGIDTNTVQRIDLNIPDQIFDFQEDNNGVLRVQGIRDYQRELVFWNYPDGQTEAAPGVTLTFPNKVLVYNYRNRTWAIFRDSVTCFGVLESQDAITWDSPVVSWDDDDVTWDDVDINTRFPYIVSTNQQGYVHNYGYVFQDEPSLSVSAFTFTSNIAFLTITNHNLATGEIIYLTTMNFVSNSTSLPITTNLNNAFFRVTVIDANTVSLSQWNFLTQAYATNFILGFTPSTATYVGGGQATLFSPPMIQTKDFNPYQQRGLQTKLSYIDVLLDTNNSPATIAITGITQANPAVVTSPGHGLQTGQQIIIENVNGMTQINFVYPYSITVIDANTFSLNNTNTTTYSPYTSGGDWYLLIGNLALQLFVNSSPAISGNLFSNNKVLKSTPNLPYYGPATQYAWYRFYATVAGQYFNVLFTYDDNMMNTLSTHSNTFEINAMNMWTRRGGKILF